MTSLSKAKEKIKYRDTLDHATRERYDLKTKAIDGNDPYEVNSKQWSKDKDNLPEISYPDIVNYLVYNKSAYTYEDLKAYKSLEAYNQFVCGWVSDVCHAVFNNKILLLAKVRHSQRMNETPLRPWVIAEKNGIIETAHCNCMAGLGEACSHVGALLFYVEAAVKIKNSKTVTQEAAYWKLPSGLQKVEYRPVREINFKSAKSMKKCLDESITGITPRRQTGLALPNVPAPTEGELGTFFRQLHVSNRKPVLLSVKQEFSSAYVPVCTTKSFPPLLSELHMEDSDGLSKEQLYSRCEQLFETLNVTEDQCTFAEIETRDQANNKMWHHLRTGRITASRMKSVCATPCDNPSKSLVTSICFPTSSKFSTAATRWGCQHEETARRKYCEEQENQHFNFKCQQSGLVINPRYPHIGASPDAVVSCDCCGLGCLEIKCPFCVRDKKITDSTENISFLELKNGRPFLKTKHAYYFQVQTQIFVCKREYCDFVTWTEKDMHIERIEPDEQFWEETVSTATTFFKRVILPELVGNIISKPRDVLPLRPITLPVVDDNNNEENEIICVCQKVYNASKDNVIGCDDENCPFRWFHFRCVNIKRAPKGTWYCPNCREKHNPKPKQKRPKVQN